ncbi:hypothetical protein BOSP111201_13085 [Bordetella sputigena]|uniref:hypothetical protein n=1 Tax=Bordetella sputigena TaxID=1416810 RepID=UPI0039EF43E0
MFPNPIPPVGSSLAPTPPRAPGAASFSSGQGRAARVDLPPRWCTGVLPAKLVACLPSETRRAAGLAMPPAAGGSADVACTSHAAAAIPDDPSASPPRTHAGAMGDGAQYTCSNAEFLQLFRTAHPGVQPCIGLVPHELRMGRSRYLDLNQVERTPTGNISETETVWDSCLVLSDAQGRTTPAGQDLSSSLYFDSILLQAEPAPGQIAAFLAQKQAERQTLVTLLSRLDMSATYRLLLRRAVDQGLLNLSGPQRWFVALVPPSAQRDGMAFYGAADSTLGVDRARRLITLPLRDDRPVGNFLHLFAGGRLMPMDPVCHAIRAMVSVLSEANPHSPLAWTGADGRVDPQRIVQLGAGERGAVDYLSQRILAELGLDYLWLSPLTFAQGGPDIVATDVPLVWRLGETARRAFDAIGGIDAVEQYVAWQNAYLEELFPLQR